MMNLNHELSFLKKIASKTNFLFTFSLLSSLVLSNSTAWSAQTNDHHHASTTTTEKSSLHASSLELIHPSPADSSGYLDYMFGTGAISAPFGAAAYGETGYSQLLWGKKHAGSFLYGYIRPAVKLQTSILVNRAEGYLDFYPLSFLGLTWGGSATSRNTRMYSNINCTTLECTGTLYRSWVKPKLSLGYKNLYWVSSLKYENLKHSSSQAFADEVNVLLGHAEGDQSLTLDTTVGYQWSEKLHTGIHGSSVKMLKTANMQSHMLDLYTSYSSKKWKYLAGAGVYQSSLTTLSPTAYVVIQWMGKPSLALN